LKNQPEGFIDGVDHAALDPFRGYANAIHDGLPDAIVLDAFHWCGSGLRWSTRSGVACSKTR
jgi:transposase